MEAARRSKRRTRVYSLEPDAILYASFPCNYVSNLLPALIEATSFTSNGGNKEEEIEKLVRYKVDMALALSTTRFRWSRALKEKLERGMNAKEPYKSLACRSIFTRKAHRHFSIVAKLGMFRTLQSISRPLIPVKCDVNRAMKPDLHSNEESRLRRASGRMMSKKRMIRGGEEFGCRLMTLRRILPGGSEMGVCELLSEVKSYMVCLELQVSILRSLVATHGNPKE